jgi:hypothetical protein
METVCPIAGHKLRGRSGRGLSATVPTRANEKTDAPTPERRSTRQVSGTSMFIDRRFRDRLWPRNRATVAVDGVQPMNKRHRVPRFPRLG